MKLAAIYNIWDGVELFGGSLATIKDHVDEVIVIYQAVSNFGEVFNPAPEIFEAAAKLNVRLLARQYIPEVGFGSLNETRKRNLGLMLARQSDCTHFLFIDCDEYYNNFGLAKDQYLAAGKQGSVCPIFTYFKLPTLRLENEDSYYVPFIHLLGEKTEAGKGTYPYYVDPTRKVPCDNVALLDEPMHHFSYVRRDIGMKCRNSSAKKNIGRSDLLKDYHDAAVGPGFYVKDFRQKLIEVPNIFNINI